MSSRRPNLLIPLLIILLGLFCLSVLLGMMDAVRTMRCKRNTRVNQLQGYSILMEIEVDSGIALAPVVSLDYLVLVNKPVFGDETLLVFDRLTGNLLWDYPMNGLAVLEIDMTNEILVAKVNQGIALSPTLMAFDLRTGALMWEVGGVLRGLAISDTTVAFFGSDRGVHVYDIQTGALLWEQANPGGGNDGIYIHNDMLYVLRDRRLNSYAAIDGTPGPSLILSSPDGSAWSALTDNGLLVLGMEDKVSVVDIEQASLLWSENARYTYGLDYLLPPAIGEDNTIYHILYPSILDAIHPDRVRWGIYTDNEFFIAPPQYANGNLFLMISDGAIMQIDTDTHQEIGRFVSDRINRYDDAMENSFYRPGMAVYRDRLYATFGCSTLYVFEPVS